MLDWFEQLSINYACFPAGSPVSLGQIGAQPHRERKEKREGREARERERGEGKGDGEGRARGEEIIALQGCRKNSLEHLIFMQL